MSLRFGSLLSGLLLVVIFSSGCTRGLPAGSLTSAAGSGGVGTGTSTGSGSGSGSTTTGSGATPAPTVNFSASTSSIVAGQNTTLSWNATNATSVQIDHGIGAVATSGSVAVSPTQTTTYTITVTGSGGTTNMQVTVSVAIPSLQISASPASITVGDSTTLMVSAANVTQITVTNNIDQTSQSVPASGGTLKVVPGVSTVYTATASTAAGQTITATVNIDVERPHDIRAINHVIFMMQENRSFDSYFGMLNPYRHANGWDTGDDGKPYVVDGIDDKLTKFANMDDEGDAFRLFKLSSSCIDDESSAWLESFGDVNRYDFSPTRSISMDGFVHTAEGFAKSQLLTPGVLPAEYTDTKGRRVMGYYDQDFLNYYYFMASQFALSDRWFSPVAAKTIPNRIATLSGGTTEGLVRDPSNEDKLPALTAETIFEELDKAGVTWKIYYSVSDDSCPAGDDDCSPQPDPFPATTFPYFTYAQKYLYDNPSGAPCVGSTQGSLSAVGDKSNSFCIDLNKIAPLNRYFEDLDNGNLPKFAFIEAGYGHNDEHPGYQQPLTLGQQQMAKILNAFMASPTWKDSAFFFAYDEGGGSFDHVPPVPSHSNDNTDSSLGAVTDISSIAVNPDGYKPCLSDASGHCDLEAADPGAHPTDAAGQQGFAAQLGFRVPNMVISPFTRKHYVSHVPMDHTAVIRFVERRFIGPDAHLTKRDAAQPDLLDFFDFDDAPWMTPPASIPTPVSTGSSCHADNMGPA